MLRALKSRNYRLFFYGQLVSLIGTWLTQVAGSWMVYRLTHDAFMLGMVGFASQISAFLLAPLAGVLVDRWNLHRTLVITQALSMLQSLALAVLTLGGQINVPWILALYLFQGLVNAVDIPARQSFVVQMVERREDLANAIALNSTIFNAARLLGPSVAGVLIAVFGEGVCFALDALSYMGVIVALLKMRIAPRPNAISHPNVLAAFKEGLQYAIGFMPIRVILLQLAMVSLVGVPYTVLMPVFAEKVLHGGPLTLGILMAANGIGALIGGLRLAARRTVLGLGRIIPLAACGMGGGLIFFGLSHTIWLSLPLLALIGFCMITQMASGNTLLQTIVDDDKRGRVMSLFGMAFQGMMPIGSLLAGALASSSHLGAPGAVMLGGVGCLLAAGLFALRLPALRQQVRPIYRQRGILPINAPEISPTEEQISNMAQPK